MYLQRNTKECKERTDINIPTGLNEVIRVAILYLACSCAAVCWSGLCVIVYEGLKRRGVDFIVDGNKTHTQRYRFLCGF